MTTSAYFRHGGPLSEEEFFALEAGSERVELFDGDLRTTPAPSPRHQHISSELKFALRQAAKDAGLYIHEAVNVRLNPGRIPIPDLSSSPLRSTLMKLPSRARPCCSSARSSRRPMPPRTRSSRCTTTRKPASLGT
ncbi:Uma2 family endonuclease [Actinoplanes sp. NPDC049681]|uniref:Uma2 family endonuclease n=1 Tax=Actinoplanes sp. NPDC049681 TaxID=3363905 RepID=UPI0037B6911C